MAETAKRLMSSITASVLTASNFNADIYGSDVVTTRLMEYRIHVVTIGSSFQISNYPQIEYGLIVVDEAGSTGEDSLAAALEAFLVNKNEIIEKRKQNPKIILVPKVKGDADRKYWEKKIGEHEPAIVESLMKASKAKYDIIKPPGYQGNTEYYEIFYNKDLPLKENVKIVLAGDPLQLGPVVLNPLLRDFPKKSSMMERLMKLPIYDSNLSHCEMLQFNYRSTAGIVGPFSKLWYHNKVIAKAENEDQYCGAHFLTNNKDNARVFVQSIGQPRNDSNTPSFYNTVQANAIVDIVNQFVRKGINGRLVDPTTIGIVSPYAGQKFVLEARLEAKDLAEVQVGTAEYFHGRDRSCLRRSSEDK